MSVVLAKCLQLLEMHHLKNNFKEDKKQLRILILVAFFADNEF